MDASMPLPKYHQLYLVLREQLADGLHAHGLPGELALAAQFGLARVTVRRALERLQGEGLIERKPGRGTRPVGAGAPPTRAVPTAAAAPAVPLGGLLENIVAQAARTRVQLIDCQTVPAQGRVAQALQLAPGTPVQKAVRVRHTTTGPLSLITTHVPQALVRWSRRDLTRKALLVLLEASGVEIGEAMQSLSARLADVESARLLKLDVGSALLSVQRLVRDTQGRPVQWLHGLYRPDSYQYVMELSRVGPVDAKVWVGKALPGQFS